MAAARSRGPAPGCDACRRCEGGAVDDLGQSGVLVGRAELLTGAAAVARDAQVPAGEPVLDGPVEESIRDQSGGGSAGDPGVDVSPQISATPDGAFCDDVKFGNSIQAAFG